MRRTLLYAAAASAAILGGIVLLRDTLFGGPPRGTSTVSGAANPSGPGPDARPLPSTAVTQAPQPSEAQPAAPSVTDARSSPPRPATTKEPTTQQPAPRPPGVLAPYPVAPRETPPEPVGKTVPTPSRTEPDLALPVPPPSGQPVEVPRDLAWLARADLPIVSATLTLTDAQRIELARLVEELRVSPTDDPTESTERGLEWSGKVLALLSSEQRELLGRAQGALRSTLRPLDAAAPSPPGAK